MVKSKILLTFIFFVELIRSISVVPDFIVIFSFLSIFLLVDKNKWIYALYFVLYFVIRFILDSELSNFNFILSIFILLSPITILPNIRVVNILFVLFLILPIVLGFGLKVRESGFSTVTIMESNNAFLLVTFLIFFLNRDNSILKLSSFVILTLNQSKLALAATISLFKYWKLFFLTAIPIVAFVFSKFSDLFPLFVFQIEKKGLLFFMFSGRIERLQENFGLDDIKLLGTINPSENFELEPVNILYQFGLVNFILIFFLLFKKISLSKLAGGSKLLILLPIIFTGHLFENPLVVLLLNFVLGRHYEKAE